MWFPNRSDTNQAVQSQMMARDWKFWIQKLKELYYPCSENKGADQLRGYREADSAPLFSHMQIVGFLTRRLILYRRECWSLASFSHYGNVFILFREHRTSFVILF